MLKIFFSSVSISIVLMSVWQCKSPSSHNAKPLKDYANIFKVLDGTWQGTFYVYRDTTGQKKVGPRPKDIDASYLHKLPLKLESTIEVTQNYYSETPYYQTVNIRDTYKTSKGDIQVIESTGYNEVRDGKLLCVVNKPDEKVVLQGQAAQEHTIIWQRSIEKPLKIEYFKETVQGNQYTIIGWGYYGSDKPNLSPVIWFFGDYKRQP